MSNNTVDKYKLSRRGRKLQISEDSRILLALPKDVSERTWAEILQKEEDDLIVLDIREEILERAGSVVYRRYLERQAAPFTVYCAAEAWLKLIDWHFYRHDPGEESSAYPPCHIPNREQSWSPDLPPAPSPADSWCQQDLDVVEDTSEQVLRRWPSNSSVDLPVVPEIPRECWFPGRLKLCRDPESSVAYYDHTDDKGQFIDSYESRGSDIRAADSELLQKVTDYTSAAAISPMQESSSQQSAVKTTTPVNEATLRGAGDTLGKQKKTIKEKSKSFSRHSVAARSRASVLPPLQARSRQSFISDCRLRSLRLDTQYEVTSEKMDTPPNETVKRK